MTTQAQIPKLVRDLPRLGICVPFITLDFGVSSDRAAVIPYGHPAQRGTAQAVRGNPRHPWARALLAAVPRLRT